MAWSRVYHIYYDKFRRLSLSSRGRQARYLSYIQNSYVSVHSFGTSSVTPCLVIPPSCPALSTAPIVVAIGLAGSVPIGRGNSYGAVRSVRGPVGVAVRFRVQSFGSEFWVGVWLELAGFTQILIYYPFRSETDFAAAQWFLSTGCTKGDIDRFFGDKHLEAMQNLLSFTSYDELMGKIYDIPHGIKNDAWNITEIKVEQETIGLLPSTYQIRYRNIISVLEFLMGHEPFEYYLSYAPVRQFGGAGADNRIYDEMHTGDWCRTVCRHRSRIGHEPDPVRNRTGSGSAHRTRRWNWGPEAIRGRTGALTLAVWLRYSLAPST